MTDKNFQNLADKFQEFCINSADWRAESKIMLKVHGDEIKELKEEHNRLDEKLCLQIKAMETKLDILNTAINQKLFGIYFKLGSASAGIALLTTLVVMLVKNAF